MAVQKITTASSIGDILANLLHEELSATRLWTARYRDYIEFWLLTGPISADQERHFYGIATVLFEQFPDTFVRFHVINPRLYDEIDLAVILPADAEEIRLR